MVSVRWWTRLVVALADLLLLFDGVVVIPVKHIDVSFRQLQTTIS